MSSSRPTTATRAMVVGTGAVIVGTLPGFLTGALAVELTRDLVFGSSGLGLAVALYRLTGATASPWLGRLADRLGAVRSIRLAALIAAVGMLGIATSAQRWGTFVAWLMLCGCSHALAQPASNRLLTGAIDPRRLGTAFGLKQSAPPAATMIAGFSVPALAVTLGWRWAYVLAALLGLAMIAGAGRRRTSQLPRPRAAGARAPLRDRGTLALLAATFSLGTFSASATTTFYVAAAVDAGSSQQFAGTMLAVAGLAAIAARVSAGVVCDRMASGHLYVYVALLGTGAVGLVLLSTADPTWMTPGVLVALAGTWGINGVFWYALIRAYPDAPGRVTGALFPGPLLGSTTGPVVFGLVTDATGFPTAWRLTTVVAVIGAAAMVIGARRLAAATDTASTTPTDPGEAP